ncbi:epoxide hydrolase 1 [Nocardiopsis sp. EMB25]|uniref:epoxide hydrolase family protein n=1 Tax=Nocardiopsis sp. EMB25 TaxID=2835867 RepID=UPI002283D88A|nr:epoxide hydrolase [Nocardiopsis sp. EMB25]MCY9782689.1 epoxide hydrolase 1 [Nocardiopsis sp. EMB25]
MRSFRVDFPQEELDDLRTRLSSTRWPEQAGTAGWDSGVPLPYLRELAASWRDDFSWRAVEKRVNAFPQFVTTIDGAPIHFLHARSPEPDAVPLLITHGWPGSFLDFLDVVGPLSDPRSHGGDPSTAFHVVLPSLPGFGFSGPLTEHGWTLPRVAEAWAQLMSSLGYDGYIAQGGDIGATVARLLGLQDSDHVLGTHVNFLFTPPPDDPAALADLPPSDLARLERLGVFADRGSGYMKLLSTRPRSVGFGMTDSPVGQLAWTAEKFQEWSGARDLPEEAIDRNALLADVTLYWLTRTAISSAYIYYDNAAGMPTAATPPPPLPPVPGPFGVAVYPHDLAQPIRSLAEREFPALVHWSEHDRGGHFAPLEAPDLFVDDLRAFLRAVRAA